MTQGEGRKNLSALGDPSSSAWEIENPGRLKAPPALLNWKTVNEKMPWNIVLLLGGGFALAKGSEVRKPRPLAGPLDADPVAGKEAPCLHPTQDPPGGWSLGSGRRDRLEIRLREEEETQALRTSACYGSQSQRKGGLPWWAGTICSQFQPCLTSLQQPHPLPGGECNSFRE